jgi:hypothetical protein
VVPLGRLRLDSFLRRASSRWHGCLQKIGHSRRY